MKIASFALLAALALAASTAVAQTSSPTLARIKAAKAITVAYAPDSIPFSWNDESQQPAGYSIDLCKRVIAQIGRAVGMPDLKVKWVAAGAADRVKLVAAGKAELECGNTSQTQTRLGVVDFSNLIFVDGGGFLVRSDSSIGGLGDMAGKKIAVLKGTTTEARLSAQLGRRLVNATVVPISDGKEGVAMLEAGSVDAYAGDKVKLVGLASLARDPARMRLLAEDLSFEPYAFALPRNDSAYRLEVNRALTQIYTSPELDTIFGRWLGKLGSPTGLLAAMYLLNAIPE